MSSYTSLIKAYKHPYGLYIGGLGESVIEQELCFCVDKDKLHLIPRKNILNDHGYCFPKKKCSHCIKKFKNICNLNK